MQVVREFRLPEGMSAEDMDSNGDGELLVALDLRSDDSLALRRVARELVNRVQKLRKVLPNKNSQKKNPVHLTQVMRCIAVQQACRQALYMLGGGQ